MSVWKGSQLIAANGSPGNDGIPGPPGRDGINGNGVLVVDTCTEISNNVDAHGAEGNTGHNYVNGNQQWCKVGGYHSGLDGTTGQAAEVFGYECHLGTGTGVHVEGYHCDLTTGSQGTHVEGSYNGSVLLADGSHLEGFNNGIVSGSPITYKRGAHIEGSAHANSPTNLYLSDGVHIGGYGLTANSELANPSEYGTHLPGAKIKTGIMGGAENTYIELIGTKDPDDGYGNLGRVMRNDGCMAIKGDLTFTAADSQGRVITNGPNADGRYTLGEIVQALIDAGILASPQ